MTVINNVNHFTAEEVTQAVEEHWLVTGRGAYRPDEIPDIVQQSLFHAARIQKQLSERVDLGRRG